MSESLSCFKAYDIRGQIPNELNEKLTYKIARAYVSFLNPTGPVIVGRDMRLSSPMIAQAVMGGLIDSGIDVIDIGQCGTEEVYFATSHLNASGGIMITASHNPEDYNGLKMVKSNAKPISSDTGLMDIKALLKNEEFITSEHKGNIQHKHDKSDYINQLIKHFQQTKIKPFKIVTNAGNGMAGKIIDLLEVKLPFEFIKLHNQPDGHFPNGVPNPLLPENRKETSKLVKDHTADFGIAWDGDFDRCFFFDEKGNFIESYYIIGLIAEYFLKQEHHSKILHDPRLTWNTESIVNQLGGTPIVTKTGHAFIKERMRSEDAVYGGEMSGHHYFKDFNYCDSGMLPWLLICRILSESHQALSELVSKQIAQYPISGELNFKVSEPKAIVENIQNAYQDHAREIDRTDGLSMSFEGWRFNIRLSNTEPLVRLNVETKSDTKLLKAKVTELTEQIQLSV